MATILQHPTAKAFRINRAMPVVTLKSAAGQPKPFGRWCPTLGMWIVTRTNNDGSREEFVSLYLSKAQAPANRIPDITA
jgi:hypothetical protein